MPWLRLNIEYSLSQALADISRTFDTIRALIVLLVTYQAVCKLENTVQNWTDTAIESFTSSDIAGS